MSINDDLLPEMIAPPPKQEQNIKVAIKDPDFPDPEPVEDSIETESVEDTITNEVEVSSEDEIIPEPKKRVVIPKKDIFKSIEPSDVPKLQKVKQKRKPRGPASEKQLETLARARAKGAETRRKKAEEKRKIKELEDKIKQQEIENKKKLLEQKLNSTKVVEPKVVESKVVEPKALSNDKSKVVEPKALSNEDAKKKVEDTIEKAVAKGIAEFEMKRKERKLEKKKRLEKEAYDKKVLNTVHKAVSPDDYWAQCFR